MDISFLFYIPLLIPTLMLPIWWHRTRLQPVRAKAKRR